MKKHVLTLFIIFGILSISGNIFARDEGDQRLKPYILAARSQLDFAATAEAVKGKLQAQGFEIAGEYMPYPSASVIVVTNKNLQELAVATDKGGFGAAIRVAITQVGEDIQVSYNNPVYLFHLYRMQGNIEPVRQLLQDALGAEQEFGSKDGLTAKKLRKYHYMFAMPYFDDLEELAQYRTFSAALAAMESGFAANATAVTKVYRIDIPGKQESLFGVAIKTGNGNDAKVMQVTDKSQLRSTPHLPYEVLVSGRKIYALKGRFRIAASFPDLSMGTFMKIRSAPGGIKDALKKVAGGK